MLLFIKYAQIDCEDPRHKRQENQPRPAWDGQGRLGEQVEHIHPVITYQKPHTVKPLAPDAGLPVRINPPLNRPHVLVVQRIEHWFPKLVMQVRFLPGTIL